MSDRAGEYRRHRKTRDRALILLLVGIALLMPPLAGIFYFEGKLFGIPGTLIYVFVVWAVLILGTARLARPLQRTGDGEDSEP